MNKIYVKGSKVIIHNPTPKVLSLIRKIDPTYTVSSFQPSKLFVPRFQKIRKKLIPGITEESILEKSTDELEKLYTSTKA